MKTVSAVCEEEKSTAKIDTVIAAIGIERCVRVNAWRHFQRAARTSGHKGQRNQTKLRRNQLKVSGPAMPKSEACVSAQPLNQAPASSGARREIETAIFGAKFVVQASQ